jgi:CRP-like cAMP-binding protein
MYEGDIRFVTNTIILIGSVKVLSGLDKGQLTRLADILTQVRFNDGDKIINQGDVGNTFYVIKSGNVKVTRNDVEGTLMTLGPNGYFGEKALINGDKRAANVIAVGAVTCLHIGRDAFEEILGPLQNIINADTKKREKIGLCKENMARRRSQLMLEANLRDFEGGAVVHKTDLGYLQLVRHSESDRIFSLEVR